MTALSSVRSTPMPSGGKATIEVGYIGLAAGAKVYQGSIVVFDPSTGYGRNGYTAPGLICLGRAETPLQGALPAPAYTAPGTGAQVYDNTGGANGQVTAYYRQGVFNFANSGAADLIAVTNIGQDCYIVDDQTVALTDGVGTRSRAGRIINVDSQGVWVQMGQAFAGAAPTLPIVIPVTLSSLVVGGGTFATLPPLGFNGRIKSIAYVPQVAGAGAGASFAVNAQIAGVSTTGGIDTVTLANTGQGAAAVVGTPITALNAFTGAQAISLVNAAGTVFTGGSGAFVLSLY